MIFKNMLSTFVIALKVNIQHANMLIASSLSGPTGGAVSDAIPETLKTRGRTRPLCRMCRVHTETLISVSLPLVRSQTCTL